MTWVKIEDQLPDHPKIADAGPTAAWLYVAGLCYCSRLLTDGRIPKTVVPRLADVPKSTPATLVRVGLWVDDGSAYLVHDYLSHQRSAEQIQNERRSSRERMANTRRTPGEVRAPETEVDTETDTPPYPPQRGGSSRANGSNPRAAVKRRLLAARAQPQVVHLADGSELIAHADGSQETR